MGGGASKDSIAVRKKCNSCSRSFSAHRIRKHSEVNSKGAFINYVDKQGGGRGRLNVNDTNLLIL